MNYILSICVPTYNRAEYLPTLLDSIISQVNVQDPIEICISDNASNDKTEQLVKQYQAQYPYINYFCWPKNMGFDRNLLRAVEIAHGEYCWLIGSDDIMETDSLNYICDKLKQYQDLAGITTQYNRYDANLKEKLYERPFDNQDNDQLFSNQDDILGALFVPLGYLSAQIVKKSLWDEVVKNNNVEQFFNTYVLLFMLGSMIVAKPKWLCVPKECVGYRLGNDSFCSTGYYNRLKMEVIGFEEAIGAFYKVNSPMYRKIAGDVCATTIAACARSANWRREPGFYARALTLLIKHYWRCPQFWLKVMPWFLMPQKMMVVLRYMYRKIKFISLIMHI